MPRSDSGYQERVENWKSSLPWFELVRIPLDVVPEGEQAKTGIMVFCPRKGCNGWFIVKLSWHRHPTRTCPHCLKTARIPKLPRRV